MDTTKYEQHVSAFRKDDLIVMNTNAKTVEGLWYLQPPFVSISAQATPKEIGVRLVEMLEREQTAVSNENFNQAYLSQLFAELLTAVGVASVDELVEMASHCGIGYGNGRYEFTPTKKVSTGEMFQFLDEKMMVVEDSVTLAQIGEALLACFAACLSQ